jgi:hypothetical protein
MTFADEAERAGRELQREPIPPRPPRKPAVRFRGVVRGRYGKGGKVKNAFVEIDRALTVHVRPFRSSQVRSVPLEDVAMWVFQKQAEAEGRMNRAKRAPRRAAKWGESVRVRRRR